MKNPFIYLSLFLLASCSPIYYAPNTHNIPVMKEKGDIRAGGYLGGNRIEGSLAYAPTAHLGVLLDGINLKTEDNTSGDGGSGNFLEGGMGYFAKLNNSLQFESYGLLGIGGFENHFPHTLTNYPLTTGKIRGRMVRYGLQPSFSFFSKYVDLSLSSRFCRLHYYNIEGDLFFSNMNQKQFIEERRNHYLIEPAITLRVGYNPVKLQIQLGNSINMSHGDFKKENAHLTLGVLLAFPYKKAVKT